MSFKFSPVSRFKIIGFPMKSICCVPCLGSSNEVRQTLSSSPSHRAPLDFPSSENNYYILKGALPRLPCVWSPDKHAMLVPQALPLFLEGPGFDLWENSWQIAVSILMDDIIWTILLIMYDYLFLFSLVAIDPQLQQPKKGGREQLPFLGEVTMQKGLWPFVPLKPTSGVCTLYKEHS